jgi:DNA (cytosine-5)-methyltransferase 1
LIDNKEHFNWVDWLAVKEHDINAVLANHKKDLEKLKGKVTLVAGGPPCQGFSMAGRRNEDDLRNTLVHSYINFVDIVRPKMIFFENVRGFKMAFRKNNPDAIPYSQIVIQSLKDLDYDVSEKIIDFSEFGVPQRRNRFIMIGVQKNLNINADSFFKALDAHKQTLWAKIGIKHTPSVEDAISDLLQSNGQVESPDTKSFKAGILSKDHSPFQKYLRNGSSVKGAIPDSHRFAKHTLATENIFKQLLQEAPRNKRIDGESRKQFSLLRRGITVMSDKEISPTLTTHPDDYLHYSEPRILTVREYARLQTFPDWFKFKGKYTTGGTLRRTEVPRYTQIGNAIPPLFGELVGMVLKQMIENDTSKF